MHVARLLLFKTISKNCQILLDFLFLFILFLLKFTVCLLYKLQFAKMATAAVSNKKDKYPVHYPAACSHSWSQNWILKTARYPANWNQISGTSLQSLHPATHTQLSKCK